MKNEDISENFVRNPQDMQKVKRCMFVKKTKPTFSPDEAFGLFSSIKLTKWQYNTLRKSVNENDNNMFPPHYQVQHANMEYYRSKDGITVILSQNKVTSSIGYNDKRNIDNTRHR